MQQQQNDRAAGSTSRWDNRSKAFPSMEANAQRCDDAAAKSDHLSVRHGRTKILALDLRVLLIFSGIYGDYAKKSRGYNGPIRG